MAGLALPWLEWLSLIPQALLSFQQASLGYSHCGDRVEEKKHASIQVSMHQVAKKIVCIKLVKILLVEWFRQAQSGSVLQSYRVEDKDMCGC